VVNDSLIDLAISPRIEKQLNYALFSCLVMENHPFIVVFPTLKHIKTLKNTSISGDFPASHAEILPEGTYPLQFGSSW
jgi:hypothetical protein